MLKKFIALGIIFLMPVASSAQKRPLSLEEAIAVGLEASPGLHASRLKVESQDARSREIKAGRSRIGPDVSRVAGLAVSQAGENLRVTQERFKQGIALNTEVLDAEVALLQAELNRTQAGIDLVLAQAKLEKALGR